MCNGFDCFAFVRQSFFFSSFLNLSRNIDINMAIIPFTYFFCSSSSTLCSCKKRKRKVKKTQNHIYFALKEVYLFSIIMNEQKTNQQTTTKITVRWAKEKKSIHKRQLLNHLSQIRTCTTVFPREMLFITENEHRCYSHITKWTKKIKENKIKKKWATERNVCVTVIRLTFPHRFANDIPCEIFRFFVFCFYSFRMFSNLFAFRIANMCIVYICTLRLLTNKIIKVQTDRKSKEKKNGNEWKTPNERIITEGLIPTTLKW